MLPLPACLFAVLEWSTVHLPVGNQNFMRSVLVVLS